MALQLTSIHLNAEDKIDYGTVHIGDRTSEHINLADNLTVWLGRTDGEIAENALRLVEAAQAVHEAALRRMLVPGEPDAIDEAKRAREIAEEPFLHPRLGVMDISKAPRL